MTANPKILELKMRIEARRERLETLRVRLDRLKERLKERQKNRPIPRVKPKDGPGNDMEQLLTELGITTPPNCPCKMVKAMMNRLGPDGCREHIDEIVSKMQDNSHLVTWRQKLTATVKSVPLVFKGKINLLHPIRSLVLIAIERFEQRTVK